MTGVQTCALPILICGATCVVLVVTRSICPDNKSSVIAGVPRYGMCTIFVPDMVSTSSVARCNDVPTPVEPKLILPGCALANAISDFKSRAGTDACVTST